ncbi:daunorubicin/doxorubicin resistance ABC transporter ATP-binding protein DrrA [Mycobacterium sp. MS1601]|uniref:ATP-binding cassette domain-containing protein n=1 Tax=Mycobacterium sp. MS1601 TaxID=1936029 RepID=UPI000979068D|nr:ATP-binding cassette domain-containing protein [Mycobacterium sp. MS1601]AQA05610.1 daunorubicin/doxorubicin resistance ABC transporter ATP-binding protein DrrA [Mycobacterium sp. MS1601]
MIELNGVGKTYGTVRALHDISFSVPTGTVCALLGHNGAGKTTTVGILSTLLRPTAGQALVAGFDVARQADQVRASIGVTGQDAALDVFISGRENLVLFSRLRGLGRKAARQRADELIERFDLRKAADRQVFTYSGGMRRRIDIAASLVVTPKVLFLDEPTTGLDPRSRRDVWSLVAGLAEQGVTVLLTTQYLEEADVLSDSIVVLNGGQIVAKGTSDELKSLMGFAYCQVTPVSPDDLSRIAAVLTDFADVEIDPDMNTVSVPAAQGVSTLSEVFRRIEALDVELIDIALRKPSLDEVFMHLTEPAITA